MIENLPKNLFNIKISGKGVNKILEGIKDNIVEISIMKKLGDVSKRAYIIGLKDDNKLVLRSEQALKQGENYELRFISGRGIISMKVVPVETLKGIYPNIYIVGVPDSIFICERRRYYRVKPKEKADVIIKRENGYALSGSLGDISLGGFSMHIQMKDRMIEYFLPMIDEEVKFSLDLSGGKSGIKIGGSAVLKHYTVDSKGFYRGGFSFSKIDKSELKKFFRKLKIV